MNRTKSIVIVIGLGCVLIPGIARSQEPAAQPAQDAASAQIPPDQQPTKEQLMRLFDVMRLRQQFESTMKMMPAMVQQQMNMQMKEVLRQTPGAKQLTPQQQAALDDLMKKYMEKAQALYPADEMIADAATVYQHHMSRSDVDAYIAFYGSPAGQHLLDAQPAIMKEYMPLVMDRYQSRSKDLYADLAKDMQDFIKTQLPPAAKDGATQAPSTQEKPAAK